MPEENQVTQQNQVQEPPQTASPVVKPMPQKNPKKTAFLVLGIVVLVSAGALTGWFLLGSNNRGGSMQGEKAAPGAQSGVKEAGLVDESTFRDSAEGTLEQGGVNGEGTHHLVRPGGDSQNVYLTSTVIDLESFVGKKVQVWGETASGKEAGWLMDVGKIKVLE